MSLTAGSVCSGIDGLALGLERALGARTVWQSEIDPHASTVLAAHWPGVPNLGDLATADWSQVEPVDVMCFGFPCQDISSAGRRAGIEGDSSALWFDCADAVRLVQPRYLLVENVAALLVRGFDVVLGDLAEMGYVGGWGCLRSSTIGAPHRRERIFLAAHTSSPTGSPRDAEPRDGRAAHVRGGTSTPGGCGSAAAHASGEGRQGCRPAVAAGWSKPPVSAPADPNGQRLTLWPELDSRGGRSRREQTPNPRPRQPDSPWGCYEPAVRRWEHIHGPAPDPRDDRGRLNPELPEWMMGFEPGWVTDPELGIPRTAQLRLIGNAVQPQVAELAARILLAPLLDELETAA